MLPLVFQKREVVVARPIPILVQAILHLIAIYVVAREFIPWLSNYSAPQFFASYMFLLSLPPGVVIGFINGRLWRHRIVGFVWILPVLLLALAIVFRGPGVYPTMLLQSEWRKAFQFYFAPVSGLPSRRLTYGDLQNLSLLFQLRPFFAQLHSVVPALVGVAYSIGALLSGLSKIPIPELCVTMGNVAPDRAESAS
jgi:hypothetical protein